MNIVKSVVSPASSGQAAGNKSLLKILIPILILVALLGTGSGGYFYYKAKAMEKDPLVSGQRELQTTLAKVGNLIMLPATETPTLATVTDKEKLKDQNFFANSEQGDKVLIYVEAKKAILYRPSLNKIVEVAPLNITQQQAAKTQEGTQKVEVDTEE